MSRTRLLPQLTELAIVASRRSWREISLWKALDMHKERGAKNKSEIPQFEKQCPKESREAIRGG